ncbi:MAG: fibronectin type III domain-containing protein [Thermoplasmata archaeon]|nr:fibronectin type III domain-containing protein [Thermoplasmata archaeon]
MNAAGEEEPVAEYHFDTGEGSTLADSSEFNNNGTIHIPVWDTGIDGYSLSFNGFSVYTEIPDNPQLDFLIGESFSIFCWVKTRYSNSGRIFAKVQTGLLTSQGYQMYVASDGRIAASITRTDDSTVTLYGPVIADDDWHNVGIVRRYGFTLEMYVDGILVATDSHSSGGLGSTGPLYIGTCENSYWFFKGNIDELMVWDKALNLSEIQENYEYLAGSSYSTIYKPNVPEGLKAIGGYEEVALEWDLPSSDGGSSIIGYKIYRGESLGEETLWRTVGNWTYYTDTNLTNDKEYYYRVSAINKAGESPMSNRASGIPTADLDSDNDGLLDSWEETYFGDLNQSSEDDYDNDSYTNLEEYEAGTLPDNDLSPPKEDQATDDGYDYSPLFLIFGVLIFLIFLLAIRKRSLDSKPSSGQPTAKAVAKDKKADPKFQEELSKIVTLTVPSFIDSYTTSEVIVDFKNETEEGIQNISLDLSNLKEFFLMDGEVFIESLSPSMEIREKVRIRPLNEEGTFPVKIRVIGNGQWIEKEYTIKVGGTEIY